MVAGKEVSPKDVQNTERLKKFWDEGGHGRVEWKTPGDFDQCVTAMETATKGKLPDGEIKGFCANRHKEATGVWPGQEDGGRNRNNGKGK